MIIMHIYTISDSLSTIELLLHLMTRHFDRCTDKPVEVSSLSLAMVEVDFWCIRGLEIIKHARWIQLYLTRTGSPKTTAKLI